MKSILSFGFLYLIIFFASGFSIQGGGGSNITSPALKTLSKCDYYQRIKIYPLTKESLSILIAKGLFSGLSEIDVLSDLQRRHFDFIPKPQGLLNKTQLNKYSYLVERDSKGRIVAIRREFSRLAISLRYGANTDTLHKKTVSYEGKIIDQVTYYYKRGMLYAARSRVYGIKYYQNPPHIVHYLLRELFIFFNYVY